MAALLRRVTSFGQLILQFLTCVIFQTEKDKVFELKRKISVADEERFSTFAATRRAKINQRLFVNAAREKAEARVFLSRKSQVQERKRA